MTFDITAILVKGQELKLDDKAVMMIALWLISNEGKIKIVSIGINGESLKIEIKDKMGEMVKDLMEKAEYYAFYHALRQSTQVRKSP